MKKIVLVLLAMLLVACLFYAMFWERNLPLGTHQKQTVIDDVEPLEKLSESEHPHPEDLQHTHVSADTHTAAEGDGEHNERTDDEYSYKGEDIGHEEFIIMLDEAMRQSGIEPPPRPYWQRLKEIHKMVEARGYKREELFGYQISVWKKTAPALVGVELSAEERKRLRASVEQSETLQLYLLFESQDREAIEKWISARLSENEYDVPALYAKMILNHSVFRIDALMDTVEEIIVALDHFNSRDFPKEAILYEALAVAMNFGAMDESAIEHLKQKGSPDKISGMAVFTLFGVELAGDW